MPAAIGRPCPICGKPMLAGQALDLDHTVPLIVSPYATGDRMVHAKCNRGRGLGGASKASWAAGDPAKLARILTAQNF
jgi:hypothetical protein